MIMSKIGPIAKKSIYATLQSAGMRGYGAGIVNGVTRVSCGLVKMAGMVKPYGRKKREEGQGGHERRRDEEDAAEEKMQDGGAEKNKRKMIVKAKL